MPGCQSRPSLGCRWSSPRQPQGRACRAPSRVRVVFGHQRVVSAVLILLISALLLTPYFWLLWLISLDLL